MSLFKARDLWSTHCGGDESFDRLSIITANIGGHSSKIIVGSHNGYLRVFQPSHGVLEDGTLIDYKPTDLLLETQLSHPILQVTVGRLVSGSQNLHICILHPRSVAVYSLATRSGAAEHGDQSRLVLAYEHQLRRSAFSMVVGPFGGVTGRDFLCVQSLDGGLCFFEQETFAFLRFLPLFLLPGPFVFLPHTDAFLTVSSNWNAECYRYQVLAEAGGSEQDVTSGRKISADWSYNLGEAALDVVCVTFPSHADVVILGERNLFCLRDNGTLKFMKRLEYKPCCLHTYISEPDGKFMVLVVTDTNTLLVYDQTTLRWSAQLVISPVAVTRMNLENLDGVLVLMSESGELQCCYLGTEPSLFMAPPLEITAIDYDDSKEELVKLQKVIRAYSKENSMSLANTAADREVGVSVSVSPHTEPCSFSNCLSGATEEPSGDVIPMCRLTVELLPHSPLSKVQVSFIVQPPLKASEVSHTISSLCERSQVTTYIYLYGPGDVATLDIRVVTSYVTSGRGIPRVLQTVAQLPLKLAVGACQPAKEADLKITINSNQPAVGLAQLFPEFIGEGSMSSGSNAIGFARHGNASCVVTVLSAKTSQRYRLQSDTMPSLCLMASQLVNRLNKHFAKNKDFSCSFSSSIPLQELYSTLDTHFSCRRQLFNLKEELGQRATQFRVIQRRLLMKFKDKTPTPISNLDVLLKNTHQLIVSSAEKVENCQHTLEHSRRQLACMARLVLLLLHLSPAAVHQHFTDLQAALSATVNDAEEQGWEEVTDVAISYLLRTSLAKTVRDQQRSTPLSLALMKDTVRFRKHIAAAIDRVSKSSLSHGKKESKEAEKPIVGIPPIPEALEAPPEQETVVPTGSLYAERKQSAPTQVRGRSAGLLQVRRGKTAQDVENGSGAEASQQIPSELVSVHSAALERLHTPKDPALVIESPPEIFPDDEESDIW